MNIFRYNATDCCFESAQNNKLPVYESEACINQAISDGCLLEGAIVATPSGNDGLPVEGDAYRIFTNAASTGVLTAMGSTPNTFNCVYQTSAIWCNQCNSIVTPNLTASSTVSATSLVLNNTNIDVKASDCAWCLDSGDIKYNGTSVLPSLTGYATETYACCCAKVCAECCGAAAACSYFEGCFADCFACCIAEWWTCNKGNINTSDPGRDNSLWVN